MKSICARQARSFRGFNENDIWDTVHIGCIISEYYFFHLDIFCKVEILHS